MASQFPTLHTGWIPHASPTKNLRWDCVATFRPDDGTEFCHTGTLAGKYRTLRHNVQYRAVCLKLYSLLCSRSRRRI